MSVDMTPQRGDYSINLPITFDYKGGREQGKKGRIVISAITMILTMAGVFSLASNEDFEIWQRVLYPLAVFYVGLFIMRFAVFRELWFSDTYEELVVTDYELPVTDYWQVFDIDYEYPYICYFKNGYKGVFVRLEKDAVVGKPEDSMFDHYEAIGNAYNLAHSLNLNIIHIDYMDNIGNDMRMQTLNNELIHIKNPDMQGMMADIYTHLQEEMERNYSCFDVYLFMTKDVASNFIYNIQAICGQMLGGNFITYKVLDRFDISRVCATLMNLHDFSVVEANESVLHSRHHQGIVPIAVYENDRLVLELNKTVEEKRQLAEIAKQRALDAEIEKRKLKQEKRKSRRKHLDKDESKDDIKVDEDDIKLF